MPRFGCKQCGSILPDVTGGEPVRVRCGRDACGWINVIPPDPQLPPWEIRGGAGLVEAFDHSGRLLMAPSRPRPSTVRAPTAGRLVLPTTLLAIVVLLLLPPVQREIRVRWAIYRLGHTHDAVEAESICRGLRDIGRPAARAAPAVWGLRGRRMIGNVILKESFLASVLETIDPHYAHEIAHAFTPADLQMVREQSLQRSAKADRWLAELNSSTSTARLIEALEFLGDARVRKRAAILLGQRGSAAQQAIMPLTRIIEDPFNDARVEAAEALAKIGPQAAAALPALTEMSRSHIDRETETAEAAIRSIQGTPTTASMPATTRANH